MALENGLIKVASLACGLELMIYWGTVLVKSWRISRHIGKDPNVIPREGVGQFMRLLWAPTIVAWCIQPWIYLLDPTPRPLLLAPIPALGWPTAALAIAGCILGAICLILTFVCWRQMGRSWRIGIDPKEKTELVVRGAYRFVRHPIYSLSMFLMIGTLLALPTPLMVVTALVHIAMLQVEARREESYLVRLHGSQYRQYRGTVGRFIPQPWKH